MIKKLLLVLFVFIQVQSFSQIVKKETLSPLVEVSIIGTSAGNWDTDVALQTTDGENYYLSAKELVVGELKFRSNKSWTQNWGSASFPSGVGTLGGQNIPVAEQATYNISFNILTGAYNFEKVCICPALYAPVCANGKVYGNSCEAECAGETTWVNGTCEPMDLNIYISGSAIGEKQKLPRGGVGFVMYDADVFEGIYTFSTGDLHFEVQEQDMLYFLSGTTFPSGTASINYEAMIPVKAGKYAVRINIKTKEYSFIATPSVSIADVNLIQVDNLGNYEAKNVTIGEVDLTVFDNEYGNDALMILYGNDFPQGLATMETFAPVKTIPGTYNIYYNTNTKEYRFESVTTCICPEVYMPVCANGKTYGNSCEAQCAGENTWVDGICKETYVDIFGSAVGDPVRMIFENGVYTVKNKTLAYGDVYFGGKLNGKSIQIGGNSFPNGIAEFDEKPVLAEAGEYDIVLKLSTSGNTYTFTKLFMGVGEYNKNGILVMPNPVKDILNISSNEFTQAKIYDCTGRLVKEVLVDNQQIDFSDLASGHYILKIQSSTNQEAIKIIKE